MKGSTRPASSSHRARAARASSSVKSPAACFHWKLSGGDSERGAGAPLPPRRFAAYFATRHAEPILRGRPHSAVVDTGMLAQRARALRRSRSPSRLRRHGAAAPSPSLRAVAAPRDRLHDRLRYRRDGERCASSASPVVGLLRNGDGPSSAVLRPEPQAAIRPALPDDILAMSRGAALRLACRPRALRSDGRAPPSRRYTGVAERSAACPGPRALTHASTGGRPGPYQDPHRAWRAPRNFRPRWLDSPCSIGPLVGSSSTSTLTRGLLPARPASPAATLRRRVDWCDRDRLNTLRTVASGSPHAPWLLAL